MASLPLSVRASMSVVAALPLPVEAILLMPVDASKAYPLPIDDNM